MIYLTRLFVFLANMYILSYVYLLELNNCECSRDWRRDYIFYYSIIYIFTVISFLLLPDIFYKNMGLAILLKVMLALLLLVNIYCLYTYADKLEKIKCKCSKNFARNFMKIFSYFYVVVLVLVFMYLMIYYINNEYKTTKKMRVGKGKKLTSNNLEKIMIVRKT